MSDNNSQMNQSPGDYKELNFEELQIITQYINQQSVPRDMTIIELQRVLEAYANLLNISTHNLNLLKSMAGEPHFEIPDTQEVLG